MQNNHSNLIRDIQGNLSDFARVCTRYNKPGIIDKLDDINVTCHTTKLVLADYGNNVSRFSVLSFTLKIMQIVPDNHADMLPDALDAMVKSAIGYAGQGDSTFKLVDSAADALKHSGLNSSYVYALRDIAACVNNAVCDKGRTGAKIQYVASATFGNPCVGMVFVYANKVFILQFTD